MLFARRPLSLPLRTFDILFRPEKGKKCLFPLSHTSFFIHAGAKSPFLRSLILISDRCRFPGLICLYDVDRAVNTTELTKIPSASDLRLFSAETKKSIASRSSPIVRNAAASTNDRACMDNHEPFLPFVRTRLPANSAQSFRESLFCFKKSPQQYCNNEARFGRTYKLGSGSERTTNSCLSRYNKAHMQCLAKAKKRVATLSRRGKNSTALR